MPKWTAVALTFAAALGLSAAAGEGGGLKIDAKRLPKWKPGVEGGIPEVPNRVDAKRAGCRGDGRADDAPALQKAIDALKTPGAVFLPAGTYLLKSRLRLKSGAVLRGAGPDKTHLRFQDPKGYSGAIEIVGASAGPEVPLASGYQAGSTKLVLEKASGLRAGGYAALYCDNDPKLLYTQKKWNAKWARNAVGQVVKVRSIRGTRLEIDRPLRLTYRKELKPRLRAFEAVERAGVEDLHIRRAEDKESFIIKIVYAADCWVRNVHSEFCYRAHVWTSRCRGLTVRDSLMHHAHDYGGGGHGYGVVAGALATDCLIENNVFYHLRHAMMTKQGAGGNVFAYNASYLNHAHKGKKSYGRLCDISQHGHYSYMNLFEGNVVQFVAYADYWGPTGPYSTCFRNRVVERGIEVRDHSHEANVMANTFRRNGIKVSGGSQRAWMERNLFLKAKPAGLDGLTAKSPAPGWKLPASLYLAKKPTWWGERRWPAIGADVDHAALRAGRKLTPIPAEERYRKLRAAEKKEDAPK